MSRRRVAVILAAGKGTRMRSKRPKVLHSAAGKPLLAWVMAAARAAGCEEVLVVIGHGAEEVRAAVGDAAAVWVWQRRQRGTGHALAQVEPHLAGDSLLLVLSADVPLVTAATLDALAAAAGAGWGAMATAELPDPGSLGRVLAGAHGRLEGIVEAADATPAELAVQRVNAGLYALPAPAIFEYLRRLEAHNAQDELYLTDALTAAAAAGETVALYELDDPDEALGVNTRSDLSRVHRRLVARQVRRLEEAGVTFLDPAGITVHADVEGGTDTVVHAGASLLGRTRLGAGCTLHQGAWLRDVTVGDGATVGPYAVLDGVDVAAGEEVPALKHLPAQA